MSGSVATIVDSVSSHLEPRDVVDFLIQEHALSDEDYELISAQSTRKNRCKMLVTQINNRINYVYAFQKFVESLQYDHSFLMEKVSKCVNNYLKNNGPRTPQANRDSAIVKLPPPPRARRGQPRRKCQSIPLLSSLPVDIGRGEQVIHLYNVLSNKLNRGELQQFENHVHNYMSADVSPDYKCIVMYLSACRALFQDDLVKSERLYRDAMLLVPKTKHPVVYEVEMMSVKAWLSVKRGEMNKLERIFSGAMQKIITEPRCDGKVAGWIYVDYAHFLGTMLESTNPRRSWKLKRKVIETLETAIAHFNKEKGNDGPFGRNFANLKYASVLLQCGNKMQFANSSISKHDFSKADHILRTVETSNFGLPKFLRVFFYIAMADLNFRRANIPRAIDYCEDAVSLASDLHMDKQREFADIRVAYLKSISEIDPSPTNEHFMSVQSNDDCMSSVSSFGLVSNTKPSAESICLNSSVLNYVGVVMAVTCFLVGLFIL